MRYRFLFEQMVRRELRQKYKGSTLGVLWYLVNPLVLMGAYALVFNVLLKVADLPDYPLFLIVGLIVWVFFSQALLAAAPSLVRERAAGAQGALPARDDPGVGGGGAAGHVPGDARAAGAGRADRARQPRRVAAAAAGRGCCLFCLVLGFSLGVVDAARPLPRRRAGAGRALLPWFFLTPIFLRVDDFPGVDDAPVARRTCSSGATRSRRSSTRCAQIVYAGAAPSAGTLALRGRRRAAARSRSGVLLFRRMERDLAVIL